MGNRSLADWLKLAADLKPVIEQVKSAKADGKITIDEGLALAVAILGVLSKHNVTLDELADLANSVGPLLPLLKSLAK